MKTIINFLAYLMMAFSLIFIIASEKLGVLQKSDSKSN